jgi:hypothetical protein
MKLILHMVWKDMRRLRLPLTLWVLFMAAKLLFFAFIAGVIGHPNLDWLSRVGYMRELILDFIVEPLIAYFLVAFLVYDDPLADRDAFWVTRPISGGRLLAAKAIGAALMFVALPVIVDLPWWVACGFGSHEIFWSAFAMTVMYSIVVIVGMACASATNGFPRYALWTIVGVAAVATAHIIISLTLGKGVGLFTGLNSNENRLALRAPWIFVDCLLLISVAIIYYQFFTRFFRRSLVVVVTVIVLCFGFARSSRLGETEWRDLYGPERREDARFHVRMVGAPTYDSRYKYLSVPMFIEGLRDDEVTFRQINAEWTSAGSTVWKEFQYYGNQKRWPAAVRSILNLPKENYGQLVDNTPFVFPERLVTQVANGRAAFHDSETLSVRRGTIRATLPMASGSWRHSGGSYSISDVQRIGDEVRFVFTERYSRTTEDGGNARWTNRDGNFYFALVRGGDAGLIDGTRKGALVDTVDGAILYSSWADLGMVSVSLRKIVFKVPANEQSGDLSMVVIYFGNEHVMKRTLDVDPFSSGAIGPHHS